MTGADLLPLLVWASRLSGYPVPEGLPIVEEVTQAWMHERACPHSVNCPFFAIYDDSVDTVYLLPGLTWRAQDNLVVHELVHFLQDRSGQFTERTCENVAQREREAYHVQRIYIWMVQNDFGGLPTPPMRCT